MTDAVPAVLAVFHNTAGREIDYDTLPVDENGFPEEFVIRNGRRSRRRAKDSNGSWPYHQSKDYRPRVGETNLQWTERLKQVVVETRQEVQRVYDEAGLGNEVQPGQEYPVLSREYMDAASAEEFAEAELSEAQAAVRLEQGR